MDSRLHGLAPAKVLARFATEVEKKLRITVSIGLSCNKFLAKIASDLDKPRGFAVLGGRDAAAFLAPKPASLIFGVGKMAQQSRRTATAAARRLQRGVGQTVAAKASDHGTWRFF